MADRPMRVLFVCVENSNRSQMAEENRLIRETITTKKADVDEDLQKKLRALGYLQ